MSESASVLHAGVPCDENAPGAVRAWIRREVELRTVLDDAILVASELVTNAVLHSGCSSQDSLRAQIRGSGDGILISVRDPGISGTDAAPHTPGAFDADGMGLHVVQQLARRWGTERNDGYCVWAEL